MAEQAHSDPRCFTGIALVRLGPVGDQGCRVCGSRELRYGVSFVAAHFPTDAHRRSSTRDAARAPPCAWRGLVPTATPTVAD